MYVMGKSPLRIIEAVPFVRQAQMKDEGEQGEYTRRDFLGALEELDDLTPTEQIADYVGCSDEVAEEWMFKLEDEGEVVSKMRGNKGWIWVKKTG